MAIGSYSREVLIFIPKFCILFFKKAVQIIHTLGPIKPDPPPGLWLGAKHLNLEVGSGPGLACTSQESQMGQPGFHLSPWDQAYKCLNCSAEDIFGRTSRFPFLVQAPLASPRALHAESQQLEASAPLSPIKPATSRHVGWTPGLGCRPGMGRRKGRPSVFPGRQRECFIHERLAARPLPLTSVAPEVFARCRKKRPAGAVAIKEPFY